MEIVYDTLFTETCYMISRCQHYFVLLSPEGGLVVEILYKALVTEHIVQISSANISSLHCHQMAGWWVEILYKTLTTEHIAQLATTHKLVIPPLVLSTVVVGGGNLL